MHVRMARSTATHAQLPARRRSFGAKDSLKCQSTVVNVVDDHGATPLMLAAQHGHVECVKYLLSRSVSLLLLHAT